MCFFLRHRAGECQGGCNSFEAKETRRPGGSRLVVCVLAHYLQQLARCYTIGLHLRLLWGAGGWLFQSLVPGTCIFLAHVIECPRNTCMQHFGEVLYDVCFCWTRLTRVLSTTPAVYIVEASRKTRCMKPSGGATPTNRSCSTSQVTRKLKRVPRPARCQGHCGSAAASTVATAPTWSGKLTSSRAT